MGLVYIEDEELFELRVAKASLDAIMGSLQPAIEKVLEGQAMGNQPNGRTVLEIVQKAFSMGLDAAAKETVQWL